MYHHIAYTTGGNTSLAMFWSINVVLVKQCFKKNFLQLLLLQQKVSLRKKRLFHAVLFRCVCLQQIVSSGLDHTLKKGTIKYNAFFAKWTHSNVKVADVTSM